MVKPTELSKEEFNEITLFSKENIRKLKYISQLSARFRHVIPRDFLKLFGETAVLENNRVGVFFGEGADYMKFFRAAFL